MLRRAIATTPQRSPAVIYTLERIRVQNERWLYQRISKISNCQLNFAAINVTEYAASTCDEIPPPPHGGARHHDNRTRHADPTHELRPPLRPHNPREQQDGRPGEWHVWYWRLRMVLSGHDHSRANHELRSQDADDGRTL